MKYYYLRKEPFAKRKEITKEEAKEILKINYSENVCSYEEMLEMVNTYPCRHCYIIVSSN